jgi:hypothetical protein
VLVTAVKDETGFLVGMAIWDTKEDFLAARKEMAKTYVHPNFEVLENTPNQFYFGEPAFWG